ncbi:MAG: hypothetical protein K2L70_03150 [Clostridia bacterium]|nr:hypothetical protein [Clostridia bacterium]
MEHNEVWQSIYNSFAKSPRDVITIPKSKKGKWFFVYTQKDGVFIEKGREHTDACKIKGRRRLEEKKCKEMLDIYYRRCDGQSVAKEAASTTYNQVYWYGIFAALGI